jgi:hypothetical protein
MYEAHRQLIVLEIQDCYRVIQDVEEYEGPFEERIAGIS